MRPATSRVLWSVLVICAGALSVLTLRDVFLAQLYVPPVGPGSCVPTPRYPCGGQSVSPATGGTQVAPRSSSSRASLIPVRTSSSPSRAAAPASTGVPCRDVSWSNDQKRACAQRVQKSCTASFPKDSKKRAQCVYDGITGTGVTPPPLSSVSSTAQNTPCQGSLRDQKSCIQRARMYCADQFPSRTGSAYNQCVYDKMTTGGSDNTSGEGANNAGAGSPGIESPSSSSEPPASSSEPESAPSSARHCGDAPVYPDCRGRCAGLPSYPTYQFEDCLTKCGNDFGAVQAAYNKCMGW